MTDDPVGMWIGISLIATALIMFGTAIVLNPSKHEDEDADCGCHSCEELRRLNDSV